MIINSDVKIIWGWSVRMTRFKNIRRWLMDWEVVELLFTVGSGVVLELRGRGSFIRGRSRVPDLRERGDDKEAILERSSSSGLIVTILFGEKK